MKTIPVLFFILLVLFFTKTVDQKLLSSEALVNSVVILELANNIFALRENWFSTQNKEAAEDKAEP